MSIDGVSHPRASLLFRRSFPSHARRLHSISYKFCISAFHKTLGPPYKPAVCMLLYDARDLHASIRHLSRYPGVRGTSLSVRVPLQNGIFEPISNKKRKSPVQKLTRVDAYQGEESLDLESKILEFMENSERPDLFPSSLELMKAGRNDLVEAIVARGGWMVAGWDLEPNTVEQEILADSSLAKATGEADVGDVCESFRVQNRQPAFLRSPANCLDGAEFATNSNIFRETHGLYVASTQSGQSAHAVSLLERQRRWEKVADLFGLSSVAKPEHGEEPLDVAAQEIIEKRPNINGTFQSAAHVLFIDDFGSNRKDNGFQLLGRGSHFSEITPGEGRRKERWQKFARNGRTALPGDETVDSVKKKDLTADSFARSGTPCMKSDEQQEVQKSTSLISHHIRGLEAELVSTLDILRSGRQALKDDITIKQRHSIVRRELDEVSDALEFCETEIMNKKRELRTACAQRTALEGKLALELMELQKTMEEKDKRLEEGMQVLKMLRTARIVWANPASEVFLAGSFDGWASWRRMEKSSAGVFITALQLYPGQYEIKFVVNGEWRVDPNRPVIWVNGFENNVLTIS